MGSTDRPMRSTQQFSITLPNEMAQAVRAKVAAGETDHQLVAPAANVTHTIGQMATFGSVTWL